MVRNVSKFMAGLVERLPSRLEFQIGVTEESLTMYIREPGHGPRKSVKVEYLIKEIITFIDPYAVGESVCKEISREFDHG